MKFHYTNIWFFFPKKSLVEDHLFSNNLDLFFFTESWLTPDISDSLFCPSGYSVIRSDRLASRGGGVLLLFKNNLDTVVVKLISNGTFELVCVDVFFNSICLRFCCVYLPPSHSYQTVSSLCSVLSNLISYDKDIFILGDFNLPHFNWSIPHSLGNPSHDRFLEFCNSNALQQIVNEPTHKLGNTLDLLLCSSATKAFISHCSVTGPLTLNCDHFLIKTQLLLPVKPPIEEKSFFPDFKLASYENICHALSLYNWNDLYSCDDTIAAYNNFKSHLLTVISTHVPLRSTGGRQWSSKPRIIKRLLKEKSEIYKKYKANKSLKSLYKAKSKEYDEAVNAWHDKVESNLCKNPNDKKFYRFVNKKLKPQQVIPPLSAESPGELAFSDSEKASLLNEYFQKVYTTDNGCDLTLHPKNCPLMQDLVIEENDVIQACQNLNDKLSRTPEGIPSYFIKRTLASYVKPLTFLYNCFLKENVIPDEWKTALVVPIHKKGLKSSPENYRGVSLTSCFSRLFELILYNKIMQHLISNNLLSPYQFGFLQGRSTGSQLLFCLEKWIKSYCENFSTHVIYTDLSKAFDSISHPKLISVLRSYRINPSIINWLENFLMGRSQQVVINSILSSPLSVHSGVVQGSIIGPLLFLIYINDITSQVERLHGNGGIALFADDTKFFSTNPEVLRDSLVDMQEWFSNRQLTIANQKCFHLEIVKPSLPSNTSSFSINNTLVARTSDFRDLGIIISHDLKWSTHISKIVGQAANVSYQIRKGFKTKNI